MVSSSVLAPYKGVQQIGYSPCLYTAHRRLGVPRRLAVPEGRNQLDAPARILPAGVWPQFRFKGNGKGDPCQFAPLQFQPAGYGLFPRQFLRPVFQRLHGITARPGGEGGIQPDSDPGLSIFRLGDGPRRGIRKAAIPVQGKTGQCAIKASALSFVRAGTAEDSSLACAVPRRSRLCSSLRPSSYWAERNRSRDV